MKKTLRFSVLNLLMLVCGIVSAETYTYTFEAKTFDGANTYVLNELNWTLATDAGYFGYDTNASDKGQQIGSGNKPATTVTLSTSDFEGKVTSIKVTTSGAKDIAGQLDVNVGGVAFGNPYTLTATSTEVVFEGDATGEVQFVWTQTSKKAIYIKKIEVTTEDGASTAPARPVVSALGTVYADQYFSDPMSVEITAETGDIYYTTGDAEFSVEAWTKYEAPIEIDQTTTIRSVAYNGTENSSEVKRTYSYIDVIDGIAGLRAEFTANSVALVNLTNAVVTGVYGDYTYVEEAKAGIVLFRVSAGLQEGFVLNGVVAVKLGVYNNLKQITSILDSEKVTVTTGADIPTTTITVAEYLNNPETYESRHIKFENVVALGGVENAKRDTLLQDEDKILLYGNTVTFTTIKDRAYNVTGWGGVYQENRQLALNNVADLELLAGELNDTEAAWGKDTIVVEAGGAWTVENVFTTKSDAEVVYTSSDETVATVDAEGKVTVVGYGYAEISAATAETEDYYAGEDKFVLYVLEGNGTFENPYSLFDALYFYEKNTEPVWVKAPIVGYYKNNAFVEGIENAEASNFAVGTADSNMPVQLSSGSDIRKNCNLLDHPEMLGQEIWIYGSLQKYFGVAGIKSVKDYSLDGVNTTGIESVEAVATEGAVYDLSGRRVANPAKGVYIIGGKKVLVK